MEQQLNFCPVRRQALLQPDSLAIASEQHSLSYQQLDLQIGCLEEQLSAQGLTAGDRLVCIAANSLKLILLQLSCMRSGIIFSPINPRFSQAEIQTRLNILNSDFIWFEQTLPGFNAGSLSFSFRLANKSKSSSSQLEIDAQQV
ncbi:MAG: AMP-binding protein, partial [Psychromonas sp.]|nr:AMP-binding protein [Psychromonas sp.]